MAAGAAANAAVSRVRSRNAVSLWCSMHTTVALGQGSLTTGCCGMKEPVKLWTAQGIRNGCIL
jgi:hypothetical protein